MGVEGKREVRINGKLYKLAAPLRRRTLSTYAPKITIGDTTRESSQAVSEWVIGWRGGILTEVLDESSQQDRYYIGTAWTLSKLGMHNRPFVTDYGRPSINSAEHIIGMIPFNNRLVTVWTDDSTNHHVFHFNPHMGADTWTFLITFNANDKPRGDMAVFQGNLFIPYAKGLVRINSSWQVHTVDLGTNGIYSLAVYDDKLWAIDGAGQIYSWDGVTFSAPNFIKNAKVDVGNGSVMRLGVYATPSGETTLYATTTEQLWVIDVDAEVAYRTILSYNRGVNPAKFVVGHDGFLYVPFGPTIARYTQQGDVSTIGFDKDDGLPPLPDGVYGNAVNVLDLAVISHHVVALVEQIAYKEASGAYQTWAFLWDGSGWHPLYKHPATQTVSGEVSSMALMSVTSFAPADVLFIGGINLYGIRISSILTEPLKDVGAMYNHEDEYISGWFDAKQSEIKKNILRARGRVKNINIVRSITVYYQTEEDEDNWTLLGAFDSTTVPNGSGTVDLELNDGKGISAYKWRVKLVFTTGQDADEAQVKTPVLEFLSFQFERIPDTLWGFDLSIDFSDPLYKDSRFSDLESLVESEQLVEFEYLDDDGSTVTRLVRVTSAAMARETGNDDRGRAEVSLLQNKTT